MSAMIDASVMADTAALCAITAINNNATLHSKDSSPTPRWLEVTAAAAAAVSERDSQTMANRPSTASPFLLKVHEVEILTQSDGFAILRNHLADHYHYDLCDDHTPADLEDSNRWLIVRDVLHALLVPIVELFDKACSVAAQATRATKLEDLEYAFHGQARGAFVWLQCFLSSSTERAWCYTRGCPACVVNHSLDSEYPIRLLFAACLLSDVHYPFTLDGPTLPSFMFFLDSLNNALRQDPLWGPEFFSSMRSKALVTRNGVEDLIHQCLELDLLLSQPSSPDVSSPEVSRPPSPACGPMGGRPGMKVRRSKMARRQRSVQVEQEQWVEEMLKQCSEQLQPHAAAACLPSQRAHRSLDAVLKDDAVIVVSELSP